MNNFKYENIYILSFRLYTLRDAFSFCFYFLSILGLSWVYSYYIHVYIVVLGEIFKAFLTFETILCFSFSLSMLHWSWWFCYGIKEGLSRSTSLNSNSSSLILLSHFLVDLVCSFLSLFFFSCFPSISYVICERRNLGTTIWWWVV